MAKIGYIKNNDYNDKKDTVNEQYLYENWFNYDWVLNELSKDYNIEGIDRIGFTEDGYELFIVTDDYKLSDMPHFHYRKKEKGKKMEFHTCIKIETAEYYHHLGDEDILNNKQKEYLMKFLNAKHKFGKYNLTNWECIIMSWNHQNDYKIEIDKSLLMPDYHNLK